jgi:copper homeostasis protein
VLVEACVDSVAGARAAERGGAGRVELCAALHDGGTTPSAGTIAAVKAAVAIPVFVLVRARGGGFVHDDDELDVMRRDAGEARRLGADGLVIGASLADGRVDVERTRRLVEAAGGLPVTFHRAFDLAPDRAEALETLAALGVRRVLTAGGAPSAREGVDALAALVRQAAGRIGVLAGGGLREAHVAEVVRRSGVREVHVRLAAPRRSGAERALRLRKALPADEDAWDETDEQRVRAFVGAVDG